MHPYHKEVSELSAAAEKRLQDPEVQLPHHTRLLRLWHYPSFSAWSSLLVYVPSIRYEQSESPRVVAVTWNRPFDAQRFNDPMKGLAHGLSTTPTVTLKQASLSRSELDLNLRRLEEIKLPMILDRSIVLDGDLFGIETFGGLNPVRLNWHSGRPEGWFPLREWYEEMQTFLERSLE